MLGNMRIGNPANSSNGRVDLDDNAGLFVDGQLTIRGASLDTSLVLMGIGAVFAGHVVVGRDGFGEHGFGRLLLSIGTDVVTPTLRVGEGGKLLGNGTVLGNVLREKGERLHLASRPAC